jgi:hypothetical protein
VTKTASYGLIITYPSGGKAYVPMPFQIQVGGRDPKPLPNVNVNGLQKPQLIVQRVLNPEVTSICSPDGLQVCIKPFQEIRWSEKLDAERPTTDKIKDALK